MSEMIQLYSPKNEVELAVLKSVLDAEGIEYYVRNDHFGSLKVGPRISLFNAKTLMVAEKDFDRAKGAITSHVLDSDMLEKVPSKKYTWTDKLRMVFEVLLFSWIMPGTRRRRNGSS